MRFSFCKVMLKKASVNRRGPGSDRAWSLYLIREPRVHSNDKQRRRCERRLNLRSKCRAFAAREQRWQANRPADARGEACGFGAPLNHLIGGRLARRCAKTAPARSLPPKNGDQRLGRASLTRGNVAGSHTPGNITPETRLPGCPSWTLIEPCASRRSLILGASWKTFGRCSWPHRIVNSETCAWTGFPSPL
jgi:hypothetical protein